METRNPVPAPRERNPITTAAHRREVFWQITLPLILGLLLVLAVTVLAAVSGSGPASKWGDISLIWLILLTLLPILIFTVIIAGLAFGVFRLIGILPGYARQVQDFFMLVQEQVRKGADKAVDPALKAHSFLAGIAALRRK